MQRQNNETEQKNAASKLDKDEEKLSIEQYNMSILIEDAISSIKLV